VGKGPNYSLALREKRFQNRHARGQMTEGGATQSTETVRNTSRSDSKGKPTTSRGSEDPRWKRPPSVEPEKVTPSTRLERT